MNPFQKATRSQVFLKLAITGVTGSGKSMSAIRLAKGLIEPGQRIAFEDTENDSASLYADLTIAQCRAMKIPAQEIEELMEASRLFDVMPITPPYLSEHFADGIDSAVSAGYGAIIMDSASHFWKGILTYKDQIDSHGKGNSYTNWKQADAKFDPVIERVLQSKIHVIFCMRSKQDYAQTEENGKKVIKKLGLAPIMRENLEYEFTTVFDIGLNHSAVASKDRSGMFPIDRIFTITEATGREFRDWLKTATPKPEPVATPEPSEAEKHAANIAHLRKNIIEKERGKIPADDYENVFSSYASAKFSDNKSRANLTEFTTEELKQIWTQRAQIISVTLKHVTDSQTATA